MCVMIAANGPDRAVWEGLQTERRPEWVVVPEEWPPPPTPGTEWVRPCNTVK